MLFFFKQNAAYEMRISDWSSDWFSSYLCDAIARPVVEIFVRDHAFERIIVRVGSRLRIGQDIARIEDIEALVLHRAEIEIGNRHDIEHIEIIFAAKGLFIPGHAVLECRHGVTCARQIFFAHPDTKLYLASGHGRERSEEHTSELQ